MDIFAIITTFWGILTIPYMSYTIHDYGMKRLANYWKISIDAQLLKSDIHDIIDEYTKVNKTDIDAEIDLKYKIRIQSIVAKFRINWEPFCKDSCIKNEYECFIKEYGSSNTSDMNKESWKLWARHVNGNPELCSLINKSEEVKGHLLSNKDLFWCFPPQLIEKMNEKFDYRDKSKFP